MAEYKLSVTPEQMANLSGQAKAILHEWLQKNDYGSMVDDSFLPLTQLTIGVMLHFLYDHNNDELLLKLDNPCDILFEKVVEVLEQKN